MPLKAAITRARHCACSSFDDLARKVQPTGNTSFEFDLIHFFHLDKIPISKHPADRLASLKIIRFGFDRLGLGLGHEIGHGAARVDSPVGGGWGESCGSSNC